MHIPLLRGIGFSGQSLMKPTALKLKEPAQSFFYKGHVFAIP